MVNVVGRPEVSLGLWIARTRQRDNGLLLTPLAQLIWTLYPWALRSSIVAAADSLPGAGSTGSTTAAGAMAIAAAEPTAINDAAAQLSIDDTKSTIPPRAPLCHQLGNLASILAASSAAAATGEVCGSHVSTSMIRLAA